MRLLLLILFFFTFRITCNATDLIVELGHARCTHPSPKTLLIQTNNNTILKWKDFSIGPDELVQFIQPSQNSWVLNQVTGNNITDIQGTLEANGQVMLLNPNGILIGKNAILEVGGLIATTSESAYWGQSIDKPKGDIINQGTIRSTCGDVILVGKKVVNEGTVNALIKVSKDNIIKNEKNWAYVQAQENPYAFAINSKIDGDDYDLIHEGKIICRSDQLTSVNGSLYGGQIALFSEGITIFEGFADVESGSMEISGKQGFIHNGSIERQGGLLLLDPEADVTISQGVNYNYDGTFSPTADIVNISVTKLIEEIEKGPVSITTAYEGEGGGCGTIQIKNDVNHFYTSEYPLLFFSSGIGGIQMEGSLTNKGTGSIELNTPLGDVSILNTLEANIVNINGKNTCIQGEISGGGIFLSGEKGINIKGNIQSNKDGIRLQSNGSIHIQGGTLSNLEKGKIVFQGNQNLPLQNIHITDSGNIRTSSHSEGIFIENLKGKMVVYNSSIVGNNASFNLSGEGSLELTNSSIFTNSSLSIDLGGHLYLDNSEISAVKPMFIQMGESLFLMGPSILISSESMNISTKGEISLIEKAMIQGKGISIIGGESMGVYMQSQIKGELGPLSIAVAKNIILEEGSPKIAGAQVQMHAGDDITLKNYSKISSQEGSTTIHAGKEIYLSDSATIQSYNGDINLTSILGNIYMFGTSELNALTHGATIISGKSLIMENFSHIDSMGSIGTNVVVDYQSTGGGLVIGPNSYMTTGEAPLRLFTTKRSSNCIEGKLNGLYFKHAPYYINTSTEMWGISYPNQFFMSPYTLFHKENGLIQLVSGGITQKDFNQIIINFIGPYTAELFRNLHPYDTYIRKVETFKNNKTTLWIRRKSFGEKGNIL